MELKKTLLSCAVGTALGVAGASAHAAAVTGWTLTDFNADGLQSDFAFAAPPPGNSTSIFGAGGETGCVNATDGDTCDDINMVGQAGQGVDAFTTGFNFGGGGVFQPKVLDSYATGATTGAINATIDTVNPLTGQSLQFSSLDFAGVYQGVNTFLLGPDFLNNCTGDAAGALGDVCGQATDTNPLLTNPLGYNVEISDEGGGDYGVVVTYVGTIAGSGTTFDGNEANWRVEGVMHTGAAPIPVPAAVWLFGSGLVGLVGVARRRRAK